MITLLAGFPDDVLAVKCEGHVTRKDYEDVLIPAATRALQHHSKVRVYYEVALEFAGIDAGAVWEDFLAGVGHWSRWERIAVVSDVEWIRQAVNALRFRCLGHCAYFLWALPLTRGGWIAADSA